MGLISLLSSKKHEMLEINLELLQNIFHFFDECEFVLFTFYNHMKANIKVKAKEYYVYENFKQIFETFTPVLNNFEVLSHTKQKMFEVFLFTKNHPKNKEHYFDA